MLSVNNCRGENHLLTELTLEEVAEVNGGWGLPKWAKKVAKAAVTVAGGVGGAVFGAANGGIGGAIVGAGIGLELGDGIGDSFFGGEDYIPHPTNPWP